MSWQKHGAKAEEIIPTRLPNIPTRIWLRADSNNSAIESVSRLNNGNEKAP